MLRRFIIALALSAFITVAEPAAAQSQTKQDSAAASHPARNDYSNASSWLCRPGRQDACAVDLTTTVVAADGKLTIEKWSPNPKAPIDCFYVYPTVSNDPTPNSDMIAGPEEAAVVRGQVARFGSQCRLYALLYRQITLTALRAGIAGQPMAVDRALAYNDVVDAWIGLLEDILLEDIAAVNLQGSERPPIFSAVTVYALGLGRAMKAWWV